MPLRSSLCTALALCTLGAPAFALHVHHHHRTGHATLHAVAHWTPGQREIDPDRTRTIQQALIDRKYLDGAPSGQWDAQTEDAMQKFQSDNGWQTKLMPDSRALIKLGLGPSGADAIGAPSAATALAQSTGADTLASVHSIQN